MLQIENRQKVTKIVMFPKAFTKCQLGGDWYENRLEISFYPEKYYPDYTEVQSWLMENIDGKELNIEDVVNMIYTFLSNTYHPKALHIRDVIQDCKTHFDVIVEI